MLPSEGKPPALVDPVVRKYLLDKLSETRKSCEWLVTLGAATVFANLLKAAPSQQWLRKWALLVVAIQMTLALLGAMAWLVEDVDPAQVDRELRHTLKRRYWIRNLSLILLVMAFGMLLLQTW